MIYLSIAICFVAAIARDALRAWLKFRDARELHRTRVDALEATVGGMQERHDKALELLAVDWKRKFTAMEQSNDALRKHIDSQVAGTIAQLPQVGSGFNRRGG